VFRLRDEGNRPIEGVPGEKSVPPLGLETFLVSHEIGPCEASLVAVDRGYPAGAWATSRP